MEHKKIEMIALNELKREHEAKIEQLERMIEQLDVEEQKAGILLSVGIITQELFGNRVNEIEEKKNAVTEESQEMKRSLHKLNLYKSVPIEQS